MIHGSGFPVPQNIKTAQAILRGRNDYPPKVRNILKKYGNEVITWYRIKRTPVSRLLTAVLSSVSSEFGKRLRESEYDELFHLYLEVVLESGTRCSVEKNAVINIEVNQSKRPREESIDINRAPSGLRFGDMMMMTRKRMGSKFFTYRADINNCQDFILNIMEACSIGDVQDRSFVKQDTRFLFKNLPYLRKFSNTVTTIGARANVVTTGAGTDTKHLKKNNKHLKKGGCGVLIS
jgi:hypothetical protein